MNVRLANSDQKAREYEDFMEWLHVKDLASSTTVLVQRNLIELIGII